MLPQANGDGLRQDLSNDRHELVDVGEVDVVASVGYGDDFDARVFAREFLGAFLRNQGWLRPARITDVGHHARGTALVRSFNPVQPAVFSQCQGSWSRESTGTWAAHRARCQCGCCVG